MFARSAIRFTLESRRFLILLVELTDSTSVLVAELPNSCLSPQKHNIVKGASGALFFVFFCVPIVIRSLSAFHSKPDS
ncbi:MAG: hypothetical protein ACJAVI_000560 [Candidatus Azotimanducaceae bacterium]|jgi:hypothetical protein